MQLEFPPSGAQMLPASGGKLPDMAVVLNLVATSRPATWLCSGGKSTGMPVSSVVLVATPTTKMNMSRTVTMSSVMGHLAMQATSFRSSARAHVWPGARLPPRLQHAQSPGLGPAPGTRASASHWPLEMSTTRRLTRGPPGAKRSAITRSGGRKSSTIRNAPRTQRPMNIPNSRRGCSTLARFAKKLTDVVREVARQAFPACAMRKATRASRSSKCTV
mmetsp:Transcript_15406/g.44111  ORF Transcript_15406/g.44111 Transcript_15406/m.44111 type:complete len:218 (-) Transcript_15406:711-1364(-)